LPISFTIPNAIPAVLVLLYPFHVLVAEPHPAWLMSTAIAGVVLALGMGLFALGLFGGGDAKLLAALALWAGPSQILPTLFVIALAGGVLSVLAWLPQIERLKFAPVRMRPSPGTRFKSRREVPYGLAIAAGGLVLSVHLIAA
ncbi:MAG: prepilin peptidase, partial [Alphaproteobacteria bacterium]